MAETPLPAHPPEAATAAARAEDQLHLTGRLAAHVENTPLAVIEWDHETRVARWNSQAEHVFGWTAADALGKTPRDLRFVLDENRELAARMNAEARTGQLPRSVVTVQSYTKSGRLVWCEWYTSVLYDAAGRVVSALSLVLDVTESRATAEALALSQARVRAALDGARMLAWDLDLLTNRWETTLDIADFYGLPPGPDYSDQALAIQAVHPDDLAVVRAGRQFANDSGEPIR
jgi:two-component system, cell cycle sensor histidine kinase and response regulator CckA